MLKRSLSVLLSFCILLAMMPIFSVSAQGEETLVFEEISYEEYMESVNLLEATEESGEETYEFDSQLLELIKEAWVAGEETLDIEDYSIDVSMRYELVEAARNEYEIECYLSLFSFLSGYSSNYLTNKLNSIKFTYEESEDTTFQQRYDAFFEIANKIKADLGTSSTDFEIALAAHDYLVLNCAYDETYSIYDGAIMFVKNTGVCQAYAQAFDMLMSFFDVPCVYVISSGMNHGWNLVNIEGSWYHMDATWDDPIPDTEGRIYYKNFLHDDASFEESYEHYGWDADGLTATNDEFEDLPRGTNSTQIYKDGYWYYVQDEALWRCDYNGNNPICLLSSVSCIAQYNGRIFLGIGKSIVEYDLATGEQDVVYTMVSKELGDWPDHSKVKIYSMQISFDGLLTYTCYTWAITKVENGTTSYTSKIIDGVSEIPLDETPAIVTNIQAYAVDDSTACLWWDEVEGADGYEIYRSTEQNGEYELIYSDLLPSYMDYSLSPGNIYYYKVRAINKLYNSAILYGKKSDVVIVSTEDLVFSGDCGEGITWEITQDDGLLTISGVGAMEDYVSSTDAPWFQSRGYISTVVIEEGITSIGDYAFSDFIRLESVEIPKSVTTIGEGSFYNCSSLNRIDIPLSVTTIEARAFEKCNSLEDVYYYSTLKDWENITIGSFNEPLENATIYVAIDYSNRDNIKVPAEEEELPDLEDGIFKPLDPPAINPYIQYLFSDDCSCYVYRVLEDGSYEILECEKNGENIFYAPSDLSATYELLTIDKNKPDTPQSFIFKVGEVNSYWTTYNYQFTTLTPCSFRDGVTYVPFRDIATAAGAKDISFNADTGEVTITNNYDMTFVLTMGETDCTYIYDGQTQDSTLNYAPKFIDHVCCLPVRDVANITFTNVEYIMSGDEGFVFVSNEELEQPDIANLIITYEAL